MSVQSQDPIENRTQWDFTTRNFKKFSCKTTTYLMGLGIFSAVSIGSGVLLYKLVPQFIEGELCKSYIGGHSYCVLDRFLSLTALGLFFIVSTLFSILVLINTIPTIGLNFLDSFYRIRV